MFLLLMGLVFGLSIRDIQYTEDPSGNSPYNGQNVTVSGVVTAGTADWVYTLDGGFFIQDSSGPWHGIYIWAPSFFVKKGDSVTVTGIVQEFFGKTEIVASSVTVHSSHVEIPSAYKVTASQIATGSSLAESFEGVYIYLDTVWVTNPNLGYGEWEVTDPTGSCRVDDASDYFYNPSLGDTLILLRGILDYNYNNFKVEPRADGDIILLKPYNIEVFFNLSVDTSVAQLETARGNISMDSLFVHLISSATYSLDFCMYNIGSWTVVNGLKDAYDRGIRIRVIVDDEKIGNSYIQSLINYGIPVICDSFGNNSGSGIMHNKFLIIDYRDSTITVDDRVLTGSVNATYYNMILDANNSLLIKDHDIAEAFTLEFEEMWGSGTEVPDSSQSKFGQRKVDNTPHIFYVDGEEIEIYFSPSDGTISKITNAIGTADRSINFSILIFTLQEMADAMKSRWDLGRIMVAGIFDSTYWLSPNSKSLDLSGMGGTNPWSPPAWVLPDSVPNGLLHHKYIIIDGDEISSDPIVVTGSQNFTVSGGNFNDENILIIHSPRIADLFLQEFSARWKEAGGVFPPGTFKISEIQGTGSTSPYEGLRLRTHGVVTAIFDNRFYMEEKGTGYYRGIQVYTGAPPSLSLGDSVEVTGVVAEYHTQTEINASGGEVMFLGTVSIPETLYLSLSEIGEPIEGMLIRVSNVEFLQTGTFSGDANYLITDGQDTVNVRVDNSTNIPGNPIPQGSVDIIGVVGQYDGIYEIFPRFIEDIIQSCLCGDMNGDGAIYSSDLSFLSAYLFFGGPPPSNPNCADVNNDGGINAADLSFLANYLFFGGPPPDCGDLKMNSPENTGKKLDF
jgi:DNA/RNA endonuclease YhcR with UshA esterase domain